MEKRHTGTLAVIVLMAVLAVVGAVGGTYLAERHTSRSADPTPAAGSPSAPPGTSTSADAPDPSASNGSPGASASGRAAAAGTYPIDRVVHDALSMSVTLVSAEVTDGKLRLNFRYRNDASIPWPLACPAASADRLSSQVVLPDGRTVRPENTWCATTRPGRSFSIAPGTQEDTWGVFPVVPGAGVPFAVTWYGFPAVEDVRLG